jgi:hypothetical protein
MSIYKRIYVPLIAPPATFTEPKEQSLSNNEKMKHKIPPSIQMINKQKLTTVGEHSIPQGSITLTSMASDATSVDGPNATQVVENTAADL